MEVNNMLNGTYTVGRVSEEFICRSAKDYRFTDTGIYKVHANALMPNIRFETAREINNSIDKTIFINDDETKLSIQSSIQCQNYLTALFIGRAPLEWYNQGDYTRMGRQFIMICKNGNPDPEYRVFGTEAAIRGFNKSAGDNVSLPGGGE
jgi:hypothetical protein